MSTTTTPGSTGGTGGPGAPATSEPDPAGPTLGSLGRDYLTRLRGGDVGSLPAILGLVVLVGVFAALRPEQFTNAYNIANLIPQAAAIVVLAMGLVFVLLLGEIDLSAGFTAGTAACIMGIVMTRHDQGWVISTIACLATGVIIGLAMGLLVARLGIPSFVVTLAAFLSLQGLMLLLIGEGGTIPYRNETILALMNDNLSVLNSWILAAVVIVGFGASTFLSQASRRKAGLPTPPLLLWALKFGVVAVLTIAATAYLTQERSPNPLISSLKGIPVVVVVLLVLVVVLTFLLSRTAWGRHVYAVGGNAEAARRSGINVAMVKLSCFMMCSGLAAVAGILLASRTNSVSPSTGGSLTLLFAVGAAVIGGTSLFGGKGKIMDAVFGGFVLAVIDNGMAMLNQPSGRVYIVTGLVLLLAASVDAISRRRAMASGRL